MDDARQRLEVDRNYDAFMRVLVKLLPEHRNQLALMRDREIVDYFEKPGDAYRAGLERFPDDIFSIQEVTDEPIDLGFWSHVAPNCVAPRQPPANHFRIHSSSRTAQ